MTAQKDEVAQVQRLCSEIQLFDLCDLESCKYKNGRFCTNDALVAKFESIKEEDDRAAIYDEQEDLEDNESDFDEYEDSYEEDDE